MRRIVLLVILVVAAVARLWSLDAGVPHAVGIDEPQIVDRALRILHTGDWNTHIFDYPSLVIYLHAALSILRFLWGAVNGEWSSLDGFSIAAVYATGRTAAALIGVATVWLVYRIGASLGSRAVGLLAAAQLAVSPMHIRESRYILTDGPMTALATLAMWLTLRAMRLSTVRAYAWAGAVCGLAAATKYTGGVSIAAVMVAWAVAERGVPGRGLKLAAAISAAAAGFLLGAPYTLIDMPSFLDGFAAQFARFAVPTAGGDPSWLLYVKHLSLASARFIVPVSLAGMAVALWRPATRRPAIPLIAFVAAYFYVLASHSHVFGRYALPLVPMLVVFSAVSGIALVTALRRVPAFRRPVWQPVLLGAVAVFLIAAPTNQAVHWIALQKRADTRELAAEWLKANAPAGTRIAVENSGPTYLGSAGFRVAGVERLIDRPIDWYRTRADYLVLSGADLSAYGDYLGAGPTVFQINPTPQRWGPPIRIVKIG
jgi:4-amino-4-deoxy-L-arabinose transferase-like glycosyltransferase